MDIEKHVRKHYDAYAEKYFQEILAAKRPEHFVSREDRHENVASRVAAGERLISRWLRPGKTLDLGCGYGRYSFFLASRGHRVTGIDLSPKNIALAKKLNARFRARIRFFPSDFAALPRAGYDNVVCMDVIEHTLKRAELIAACSRSLRPGGWLLLSAPNVLAELKGKSLRVQRLKNAAKRLLLTPRKLETIEHPLPLPLPGEVERLLTAARFTIAEIVSGPVVFYRCQKRI